jgi:hypothetical protein
MPVCAPHSCNDCHCTAMHIAMCTHVFAARQDNVNSSAMTRIAAIRDPTLQVCAHVCKCMQVTASYVHVYVPYCCNQCQHKAMHIVLGTQVSLCAQDNMNNSAVTLTAAIWDLIAASYVHVCVQDSCNQRHCSAAHVVLGTQAFPVRPGQCEEHCSNIHCSNLGPDCCIVCACMCPG